MSTIASLPHHRREDLSAALHRADEILNSACCAIHHDGIPPEGSELDEMLWKIRELQTGLHDLGMKVKNG